MPYEDVDGKVLYVWLDAPIGYISATQWADENNKNWECYWQNDAELIHFIGKDIIVFILLFSYYFACSWGFCITKNVPANEFLNLEGQELSTSRNWAIWLDDYLKDFVDQQDVLRYVLCSTLRIEGYRFHMDRFSN